MWISLKCLLLSRRECVLLAALLAGVSSGCFSEPDTPAVSLPVPQARSAAAPEPASSTGASGTAGSSRRQYTGISFEIPAAWKEIPDQQFVDSKFTVSTKAGDVEVTLTSMGGGIEANLERWVGQIHQEPGDEPSWTKLTVCGVESTMVDVRGTFSSGVGAGGGPKPDWRLIGVAVPLPRDFFVKAVGPREAVAEFQSRLPDVLKTGEIEK